MGDNGSGEKVKSNGQGLWIPVSVVAACLSTLGGSFFGVRYTIGSAPADANAKLAEVVSQLNGMQRSFDLLAGELREIRTTVNINSGRLSNIEGRLQNERK